MVSPSRKIGDEWEPRRHRGSSAGNGICYKEVNSIADTKFATGGTRFVLNSILYHNCIYYNIIFENFALGILRVRPADRAGNSGGSETL